jgi:hypothetical protein
MGRYHRLFAGGSGGQYRRSCTDISTGEEIGRAHGEFFREVKPAASMIEVKGLISSDLLVEIEVTAIISDAVSKN